MLIIYLFVIVTLLLWIYRGLPYLSSDIPFWYDPWIYKVFFDQYYINLPDINILMVDKWLLSSFEPWLWFITNVLQIIWYTSDAIITFWLVFISIIIGLFIYIVLKKEWKQTAYIWMWIYYISIVQYKAFWWNYYKQILWILFLLAWIYLFQKKKYYLSIPFFISLFIINRASGVFFVLMYIFYKIYEIIVERKFKMIDFFVVLFSWILALVVYLPIIQYQLLDLIKPLVSTVFIQWTSGTFFTREEFGLNNIYLILLSFGSVYIIVNQMIVNKIRLELIHFGYIVWFLWTTLGLFFYNRLFINYDIFLIIFSAIFLGYLFNHYKKTFFVTFSLFFILQSYSYFNYVDNNSNPLIDKQEFDIIQKISILIEDDAKIIVTHKNYSPWLIGYAKRDIIAPWLFDWNKWELNVWKRWWLSDWKTKCDMLKDYKEYQNLYLWIWKRQNPENLENANCFKKVFSWENFIFLKINHE